MVLAKKQTILANVVVMCVAALSGCIRCERKASSFSRSLSKRDVALQNLRESYAAFMTLVKPIAVKRVSGTEENRVVRDYIVSKMSDYGWDVQLHSFVDKTPMGAKNFTNIIANYEIGRQLASAKAKTSLDYDGDDDDDDKSRFVLNNRVVFACHYDSKLFKDFDFIGAVDSAVPCAMLLDFARFLNENFDKSEFDKLNRHLQFVFFDGEEAFEQWTDDDSIYGSRAYVEKLRNEYGPAAFDSIELFVLLDLLGASESAFFNHFPSATGNVYKILAQIETRLIKKNMLSKKSKYYFTDLNGFGQHSLVEDDHKPFLKQNVPILHLIPLPFPPQWHNAGDNLANLNPNTIQDLRIILKYLILEILNATNTNRRKASDGDQEL